MKAHREGEQVLSGVVCSDLLISFLSLGEVVLCPKAKKIYVKREYVYPEFREKVFICLPDSSEIRRAKDIRGYARTNLPKHHRPEEIPHVSLCICV